MSEGCYDKNGGFLTFARGGWTRNCSRCLDCGECVCEGDWAFCASPQNPEGHKKGTYGWHFSGQEGPDHD